MPRNEDEREDEKAAADRPEYRHQKVAALGPDFQVEACRPGTVAGLPVLTALGIVLIPLLVGIRR